MWLHCWVDILGYVSAVSLALSLVLHPDCLCVTSVVSVYPDLPTTHDCRYVTVALAIAHYYWTRGNRDVMPRFPVLHAARTTLRWSIFSTY